MTWVELLKDKGYNLAGKCSSCGGWFNYSNGVNVIRVKSKFAKMKLIDGKVNMQGKTQLIKLTELGQYL